MEANREEVLFSSLCAIGVCLENITKVLAELTDSLNPTAKTGEAPKVVPIAKPAEPYVEEPPFEVETPKPAAPAPSAIDRATLRQKLVAAKDKNLNPSRFVREFGAKHGLGDAAKFDKIPDDMLGLLYEALKEGGYAE